MKPPNEIVADAVRDELYARAAFAALISRPAREFRAAVESNPRTHTEFMARHIVEYCENSFESTRPDHAIDLLETAKAAARHAEPSLRCRIEKNLANQLRFSGRFGEADEALQRADELAAHTLSHEVHLGVVEFCRVALQYDIEHFDEARRSAEKAISAFEATGASDRAYAVRLYIACIDARCGRHLLTLAAYEDAARRAYAAGCRADLALAYYNIAHCHRSLGDVGLAKSYFVGASGFRVGRRWKHRIEIELAEVKQDRLAESRSTAKSTRPLLDPLDVRVDGFAHRIRDVRAGRIDHAGPVVSDHLSHFPNGLQPAAQCAM